MASSPCDLLAVEDLFIVGLALDVTGAWVLARGLLASPSLISRLARSNWDWNALDAVDRVRNRVDAELGVCALIAGFVLQGVGYLLVLVGVSSDTGWLRWAAAAALSVVVVGLGFFAARPLKERRVNRLLVRVARAHDEEDDQGPSDWNQNKLAILASYAKAAGHKRRSDEQQEGGNRKFVTRALGVLGTRF